MTLESDIEALARKHVGISIVNAVKRRKFKFVGVDMEPGYRPGTVWIIWAKDAGTYKLSTEEIMPFMRFTWAADIEIRKDAAKKKK